MGDIKHSPKLVGLCHALSADAKPDETDRTARTQRNYAVASYAAAKGFNEVT